jgi:hypothetical protein
MKYIIGIAAMLIGTLIVLRTEWLIQNFGRSAWAEQHFGTSGGTRTMLKFIGIIIIALALMGMTGLLGEIIIGTFGQFFGL